MEDNKKIKIQIKSVFGDVLFEYEKENNTIKDTVEEAVRQKASLDGANLYRANLYRASLNGASLNEVNLYRASLNGASLDGASLDGANLNEVNLYGASLDGANLYRANLYRASLNGAKDIPYTPLACPSDGAFVGWKKVKCYLVKLEIPEDARRSSATTRKCRCDKAKVLDITHLMTNEPITEVTNTAYSPEITYKVGEMVYPNKFDDNRWDECSYGIHFFINKQDAINY
jgi:hypothetical protein